MLTHPINGLPKSVLQIVSLILFFFIISGDFFRILLPSFLTTVLLIATPVLVFSFCQICLSRFQLFSICVATLLSICFLIVNPGPDSYQFLSLYITLFWALLFVNHFNLYRRLLLISVVFNIPFFLLRSAIPSI